MASSYTHPSTSFDVTMQDVGVLNAKSLKPLDEVLRCRICDDYFSNCMMTKCNHNYCSVCIRRSMNYKSQCPTCFQVATEPELTNNRLIDEIIRVYKKIRENLQIPCDSIDKSSEQASSSKPVTKKIEKSVEAETSVSTASNQQTTENRTSDEVSCPVCYTTVSNSRINVHLDTCLKQSAEKSERKFLPKLVYHLLSDKEIRKKLKEHGLSTSGNRQALIRRHKNFIILYNANCDSLNPKPVEDLILEIERQELEERISASERSNVQVNKKSDPSLIEKEYESYAYIFPPLQFHYKTSDNAGLQISQLLPLQEHRSQFNALIQDVQQRALGKLTVKKEIDASEDPVIVKEEFSESLLENAYQDRNVENLSSGESALVEKDPGMEYMDSDINTSCLRFRIKKESPFLKVKDGSKSLIDDTTNEGCEKDSLDDFESSKTPVNKFPKKKYARRLSTEEKNTQRKK